MLEALLRRLGAAGSSLTWLPSMDGVLACAFRCAFPAEPVLPERLPARFEALFCRSGRLVIQWRDGLQISLESGEILLMSDLSNVRHLQWVDPEMDGVLVAMDARAGESLARLSALTGGAALDGSRVRELMERQGGCAVIPRNHCNDTVFETLEKLPPGEYGRFCVSAVMGLLYLICCGAYTLPFKEKMSYYDRFHIDRMRQVHDYLLANLSRTVTIKDLTLRFRVSPTTLKSCFRRIYGQPVHKFVQEQRAKKAAELLLSTDRPIMEIANRVGYESVSQFVVVFRRYYQVSPAEYRIKMSDSVDNCPNPHSQSDEDVV